MTELTISGRPVGGGTVLTLAGDLDLHTAVEFREVLGQLALAADDRLVIDMGGVGFCDSSGIAALLAARNHALAVEAELVLAAVPNHILRVLRLVGLETVFVVHATAVAVDEGEH